MPIPQTGTDKMTKQNGANYSAVNVGKFEELDQYQLKHPRMDRTVKGKVFLREQLGLTAMQISYGKMGPGRSVPFYHQHKENEELYLFIKGTGQMQIDGDVVDVTEGSAVRIATSGTRTLRNTSSTEDLCYIVLQAKENSLHQDTFDDSIPIEQPVVWKD